MGSTFVLFRILAFLLVIASIGFGIGYLIIKAISGKAEKRGKDLLQYLRSNPHDVRKIMGEMRFIAQESFKLYDEYNNNKRIKTIQNARNQDKLILKMNNNLNAEWKPRFLFLCEIQNSFVSDKDLSDAFNAFKDIDRGMRKLSLWNINLKNFFEYHKKNAKIALKCTAITTIVTVAVVGAMQNMVNNAGKDIGNSPKSKDRYQDSEGNIYDSAGNRVPW